MSEFDKEIKGKGIVVYLIWLVLNVAACVALLFFNSIFQKIDINAIFGALADAFFIPGFVTFAFAILLKISESGFFDGVSYGLKRAFFSLIPGARAKKDEAYADYKARKAASRKKTYIRAPAIVGGAFIVVGVVFLFLYSYI